MKKILLVFVVPCMILLSSGVGLASDMSPADINQKRDTLHMSVESVRLMQVITKDYLYLTSGVKSTVLTKEMKASLGKLDDIIGELNVLEHKSEELKTLLVCMTLGRDELRTIMREKYSMDNVKLILDVAGLISEAVLGMTHEIEKSTV